MTSRSLSTDSNVAKLQIEAESEYIVSQTYWQKVWYRLARDYLTLAALVVLVIMTLLAAAAPFITDQILHIDPNETSPRENYQPLFTGNHILGTDDIGRDQLARLLHAGGVSLRIGFFGALFTMTIGLVLGMMAGYFGGAVDDMLNWIITTLDSIPSLYLLIMFSAIFSPTAETLILVIALVTWTGTMRLIRGQTLSLREREFVHAARALGASPWRIMFVHILPNLISVTVVSMAGLIGGLILVESALSFLNLGVQPPQATWGNMLAKSRDFFRLGPHLVTLPGLMIFITVLCSFVIGDGLRDAFDPTTKVR